MKCRKRINPQSFPVILFVFLVTGAPAVLLGQQDTTPPQLVSLSFSPAAVDVTTSSQIVTVTMGVSDAQSGFYNGQVEFYSPSGQHKLFPYFYWGNQNSGDAWSGTYATPMTMERFTEPGTWRVYRIYMCDRVGNCRTYEADDLLEFQTTVLVVDNQPPVVRAGQDRDLVVHEPAQFDGSQSFDPDGSIASYHWDFGDGGTGEGPSAHHSYGEAGTYTVILTVIDNKGASATDTATVIVRDVSYAVNLLSDLVTSYDLGQGITSSLYSKIQDVLTAFSAANSGNRQDVANKLKALINFIEAHRSKELTGAQADALELLARRILGAL